MNPIRKILQDEFVLPFLQDLRERFNSVVMDEGSRVLLSDTEAQLKELERKVLEAYTLLDRLHPTRSQTWQRWAGDVTRVCYDVEDLVDDIVVGSSNITSLRDKILSFLTRGSMVQKIQELRHRLQDIINGLDMLNRSMQHADDCGLKELMIDKEQILVPEKLFGREEDKDKIISLLLQHNISSVAVVGMGGLGKTTLARNVVNDSRIKDEFNRIIWVSVSAKFDLSKIGHSILHQSHEQSFFPAEGTQSVFQQLNVGRKILIVLDDLWAIKFSDWAEFRPLFSGCKFLSTTQNSYVASVTRATPYYLPFMRDEDCRALIVERALSHNSFSYRQRVIMEQIAGEFALKCRGLPLAANILGMFLCSKCGDNDWITLSGRDIYDLRVFKEQIFPVFRLHNPDFAWYLKKCLAYCSLFPHNFVFKKDSLVQLWMIEGFILRQGTTSLKDIGGEYFDDLYWRSIFQPSHLGGDHAHETCSFRMHEFIHRFAEFVASDTYFRLEEGKLSSTIPWYDKTRHLSLLCQNVNQFLKEVEKCNGLRTFLLPSNHGTQIGQVPYSFFVKLGRLRVLDLSNTDVDMLPESLGGLKHLRYLDVSETPISVLPESTSNLIALQVLRLRDCSKLQELPKYIMTLTNLQHLDVSIWRLKCMPAGLGNLSQLGALPGFKVGTREGYRISELKNLKFLGGKICITGLENVKDEMEAREAMLSEKPLIEIIELEWSRSVRDGSIAMNVLTGLQPHKYLKELNITKYGGSSFPAWLTCPSFLLVSIHLKDGRQDILPSLGQLPSLETLHIEGMQNVECVDFHLCGVNTRGAFPELKTLKIKNMMRLTRGYTLPGNSMLKLRDLTIELCGSLTSLLSLKHMISLQNLEISSCPMLKMLPELPETVKSLILSRSDLVKEQCQPEAGPDWNIIKDIPRVEIDYITVVPTAGSN